MVEIDLLFFGWGLTQEILKKHLGYIIGSHIIFGPKNQEEDRSKYSLTS